MSLTIKGYEKVCTHERGVNAALVKGWLLNRFGEEGFEKVLKKLSPKAADMLGNPRTTQWYPAQLLREIYQAVHDEFSATDPYVLLDYGRFSAERSASGLLKYLMRLIDMNAIIKRMGTFWRHYHKGGVITATELVEEKGRKKRLISIYGYDCSEPGCMVQEGYFAAISERAGGKNVAVKKLDCIHKGDEACSWELSWE